MFVIIKFSFIFNKFVGLFESVKVRSLFCFEVGVYLFYSCEYIGRYFDCKISKICDKMNYFFKIIFKLFLMCLIVLSNYDFFFFIFLGIFV